MKVVKLIKLEEPNKNLLGYVWIESEKLGVVYCLKITQSQKGKFVNMGAYFIDGSFTPFQMYQDEQMEKRFKKALNDAFREHIDLHGFADFNVSLNNGMPI